MNVVQRAVQWLMMRAGPLSPIHDNRGGWYPWRIHEPYTGAWQRNQEWTTDSVLAHHAVYACITRISQDVGKLWPELVELDENGIWTKTQNTAHSPVLLRPNRFQNHIQFREWWTTSKLTHGNTYVLLSRDARRVVNAMYVLDPNRVTVLVAPDGEVFYQLRRDDLSEVPTDDPVAVPASEIVHDRMNCMFHPLIGTSPIFACGLAAHVGLKIQNDSSGFFANGSHPGGILSTVQHLNTTQSKELKEIWDSQYTGDNSGKVAVLGDGMKFEAMRMTAVDSQLIEQLKWSAETVCSTFHVPPWKVGIGSQPAYTKPEIANQAYYSDCLQTHIESWELCMDEALGLAGRKLGVMLDLDGLLRMDAASQYATMVQAAGGAVLTPDEARMSVNRGPLPGGNTLYRQQQEYSLAALAERDRNKPFDKPEPAPPALPPGDKPDMPPPDMPSEDEERAAQFARRVRWRTRTLRVRTAA